MSPVNNHSSARLRRSALAPLLLTLLPLLLLLLRPEGALAGHSDMFSCRTKKCPVTELTDRNWDAETSTPTFVMFYAPWCGHCKQLAPVLKKAAATLEATGVKVGAVDVEPNPTVQGKFPDIRGFPTLKFMPGGRKKAVDYNGGRDEGSIVDFAKAEAKKSGFVMAEPVATKAHAELYTFLGRAALDRKPALLVVGSPNGGAGGDAPPAWVGKLATELRKHVAAAGADEQDAVSPEAKTKELLREAARGTKVASVKAGVASLLEDLALAEAAGAAAALGPPAVSPAYTSDPEAAAALGLAPAQLPALVVASVDRKKVEGTTVLYPGGPIAGDKRGRVKDKDLAPLAAFVRSVLPAATEGPAALAALAAAQADPTAWGAQPLPAFPKPPNVVAAEAREAQRKASEGAVHAVGSGADLDARCYAPPAGKTCALLALPGGAAGAAAGDARVAAVAKQFGKEGFTFAAVDTRTAPAAFLGALFGDGAQAAAQAGEGALTLAVVKGGKRPRVARSETKTESGGAADAMTTLLEAVVGGGAAFTKLPGGLPAWGDSAASEEEL